MIVTLLYIIIDRIKIMSLINVGDIVNANPNDYINGSIKQATVIAYNNKIKMYCLSSQNLPRYGFWFLGEYETIESIQQECSSIIQNLESYNGEKCWWVLEELVTLVESSKTILNNGYYCKRCNEYYPFSTPNKQDGTLLCYSCKVWEE